MSILSDKYEAYRKHRRLIEGEYQWDMFCARRDFENDVGMTVEQAANQIAAESKKDR